MHGLEVQTVQCGRAKPVVSQAASQGVHRPLAAGPGLETIHQFDCKHGVSWSVVEVRQSH